MRDKYNERPLDAISCAIATRSDARFKFLTFLLVFGSLPLVVVLFANWWIYLGDTGRITHTSFAVTQSVCTVFGRMKQVVHSVTNRRRQFYCYVNNSPFEDVDHIKGCSAKYPEYENKVMPCKRIFIAALLHDNARMLGSYQSTLLELLTHFPPASIYVSIVESYSKDDTASRLRAFAARLKTLQVAHTVRLGDVSVDRFVLGDKRTNRIRFLARSRNLAMLPFYDRPNNTFTHVVFLNDIIFCAGDVLRLLEHPADATCGYDFWSTRTINVFYDNWVFEPLHSEKVNGEQYMLPERPRFTPFNVFLDGMFRYRPDARNTNFVHRYCTPGQPCINLDEYPWQVYACWNGMIVFNADLFRQGLRFRWAHEKDSCKDSEAHLVFEDMHRMGRHGIVVDPTVQVAYDPYTWALNMRPRNALAPTFEHCRSLFHKGAHIPPGFCKKQRRCPSLITLRDLPPNATHRCCPVDDGQKSPSLSKTHRFQCHRHPIVPCHNRTSFSACNNYESLDLGVRLN